MTPNKGQLIFQGIGSNKGIIETPYLPFTDKGIKGFCALNYTKNNSFHEKCVKNFENYRENSGQNKGKSEIPLQLFVQIEDLLFFFQFSDKKRILSKVRFLQIFLTKCSTQLVLYFLVIFKLILR